MKLKDMIARFIKVFATLLILQIFLSGCNKGTTFPELTPERSTEVRRALVAWFECEECEGNELSNVIALGEDALSMLISTLNKGPSPAKQKVLIIGLEQEYDRLASYGETHPDNRIQMKKEDFVNTYLENYIAKFKIRAATALSEIGGEHARDALKQCLKQDMREDVKAEVTKLLEAMNTQS